MTEITNDDTGMDVPQEQVDEERERVTPLFVEVYGNLATIELDKLFDKALKGWGRAPKTFKSRVDRLVQLRLNSKGNTGPEAKKTSQQNKKVKDLGENRHYKGKLGGAVFGKLNKDEQRYWLERERYYFEEFEFNLSSDYSILSHLIFDEILMQRLQEMQFKNLNENYSRRISECHDRILGAQKTLGIQREQRKSGRKKEGSISDLSIDLEEKLILRDKELKEEDEKEKEFTKAKDNRKREYRGVVTENVIRDSDIEKLVEGL